MKILIIGGDGMLGHALCAEWRERHEVHVTLRGSATSQGDSKPWAGARALFGVDARQPQDVITAIADVRPDVVVNAVGVVKQRTESKNAILNMELNALFPHRLAEACRLANARVVHLSTDCVFTGEKGMYKETDVPDVSDLYGRTKWLGEVAYPHCLTLRTSIIGLELSRKQSLIEWYLAQRGTIRGFRRAIYTGLTTTEMARAIERILAEAPGLSGVWHLASDRITKYDLLMRLGKLLNRTDVEIVPDDDFVCDRSLDASALMARLNYRVPTWDAMLSELADEVRRRSAGTPETRV